MGTKAFREMGLTPEKAVQIKANVSLEDSVGGILNLTDHAKRENTSGKFWDVDGKPFAW